MFLVQTLLPIFTRTLLPIALVASVGLLLARSLTLDRRSIGRVIFYLFTPSLVFRGLYEIDMDYSIVGRTALVAAIVTTAAGLLSWLVTVRLDRRQRAGIVLSSALSNNGNMGLPVSLFAFGESGLALATIYYVANSFLGNTVGVFVASLGKAAVAEAVRRSLRVPLLYAATAGLLLGFFDVPLPVGVFRAVDLLADAAVPAMLVLLGIQLSTAPIVSRQTVLGVTLGLRLVLAPLLAAALCFVLNIQGLERSILILQAAMPTAVMTTVLATEYDTAPRLVATVVASSTAMSLITLSFVLWILGAQ